MLSDLLASFLFIGKTRFDKAIRNALYGRGYIQVLVLQSGGILVS